MQRLVAVVAVVIAFLAGRASRTGVEARAIAEAPRGVEVRERVAPCPVTDPPVAGEAREVGEDDEEPGGIDVAATEALQQLAADVQRIAALDASLGARGAIYGRLHDAATGEIVLGATLLLTARGEEHVALTDETGFFQIADLDADTYHLTVYYDDGAPYHRDVFVASRKSTRVDIALDTSAPRTHDNAVANEVVIDAAE